MKALLVRENDLTNTKALLVREYDLTNRNTEKYLLSRETNRSKGRRLILI